MKASVEAKTRADSPARLDGLTTVRGVAAAWVVGFHYFGELAALWPTIGTAGRILAHGDLAVPLFFMLSGFVIHYNYAARLSPFSLRGYLRFLIARFGRIYPVHIVTLLVMLALYRCAGIMNITVVEAGYRSDDFVRNVFLVHAWVPAADRNWNKPSWSISSEWFVYLLFPVLLVPIRLITSGRRAVAAIIACGVTSALACAYEYPYAMVISAVPTFIAGCVMAKWMEEAQSIARAWPVCLAAGAVGVLAAVPYVVPDAVVVRCLIVACFVPLILGVAFMGHREGWWTSRLLLYLGEISYSLYMTHMMVQLLTSRLFPIARYSESSVLLRVMVSCVIVALVAAAALTCYYLVERPAQRCIRRWLGRS